MAANTGILSPHVNFAERLIPSLQEMTRTVNHLKGLGYEVVLTSGSFDLIHLGHVKYLSRLRKMKTHHFRGDESIARLLRTGFEACGTIQAARTVNQANAGPGAGASSTNQIYAICGSVLSRAEIGTGMGIVGLGSGIFGYLGPQMLGFLRDSTGGFTAGWIFVAVAAVVSLADLLLLRVLSSRAPAAESVAI